MKHSPKIVAAFFLLVLFALSSGCSNGENGAGSDQIPSNEGGPSDNTPATGNDGASDNNTSANSLPLANAGTDQSVTVGGPVTLDGSASVDLDGDELTYHWLFVSIPSGSLAMFSNPTTSNPSFTADMQGTYTVQLIVNDGKSDSASALVSIIATSQVKEWKVSQLFLENPGISSSSIPLDMAKNGEAIVAWNKDGSLFVRRFHQNGAWDSPIVIESSLGDFSNVATNGQDFIIVWSRRVCLSVDCFSVENHLMVSYFNHSKLVWDNPIRIDSSKEQERGISVAMNATGSTVVMWHQRIETELEPVYALFANQFSPASGWGATTELQRFKNTSSGVPKKVSMDEAGNAISVWELNPWRPGFLGISCVFSARFKHGIGWQNPVVLQDVRDCGDNVFDVVTGARHPDLTMDKNGNAIVVWFDGIGGPGIWANRYKTNTGWEGAVQISSQASNGSFPAIAGDDNENVTITWKGDSESVYKILASRYELGTGWTIPETINFSPLNFAGNPKIMMDDKGDSKVIWIQDSHIFSNDHIIGTGWNTPTQISALGNQAIFNFKVGTDGAGRSLLIFDQDGHIWTSLFR